MKKILALILTVVLATAFCTAGADTLELVSPGMDASCPISAYNLYFNVLVGQTNYNFTVGENSTVENGYDVWTATCGTYDITIKIYAKDGNFCYTDAFGSITCALSDTNTAEDFGTAFGMSLSCMLLSAYVGAGNEWDDAANTTYTNELTPLLTAMENGLDDDAALQNGVTDIETVMGYPIGMELNGSYGGETATLSMHFIVTSPDGEMAAK